MKRQKISTWLGSILLALSAFAFINLVPVQATDWLGLPSVEDPIVFEPQVGLPGLADKDGKNTTLSSGSTGYIGLMVKGIYDYGLSIVGILAAIVLMAGGVIWLTSGGDASKITQAKDLILGSIVGIMLLFGAWLILKTINPNLVEFTISPVKRIEPINFCCDGDIGNVQMIVNSDGATECPAQSSQCQKGTVCIRKGSESAFKCFDERNTKCCEFRYNNTLMCDSVNINADCSADSEWSKTIIKNRYCEPITTILTDSCADPCAGKDDGDSVGGNNNNGWVMRTCYSEQIVYGKGWVGDPCGNRGGSKCYKKGAGLDENGNCDKINNIELFGDSGGRTCGQGLKCCNISPAI
jgi:hypothetical protein